MCSDLTRASDGPSTSFASHMSSSDRGSTYSSSKSKGAAGPRISSSLRPDFEFEESKRASPTEDSQSLEGLSAHHGAAYGLSDYNKERRREERHHAEFVRDYRGDPHAGAFGVKDCNAKAKAVTSRLKGRQADNFDGKEFADVQRSVAQGIKTKCGDLDFLYPIRDMLDLMSTGDPPEPGSFEFGVWNYVIDLIEGQDDEDSSDDEAPSAEESSWSTEDDEADMHPPADAGSVSASARCGSGLSDQRPATVASDERQP